MLSRSFHNAMNEVKNLGIPTEEAISRHREWMSYKEEELIRKMEVKTMKKATRRTVGNGNNARVSNITSISYANGIKVKSIGKKAPKVSDCKVFKLYKDDSIDDKRCITIETFTIREDGTAHFKVENEYVEWEIETTIENAREKYAKSLKQGYTKTEPKVAEAVEKTEVEPKKQTAKKSKKADSKKAKKDSKGKAKKATAKSTKKTSKKTSKKAKKTETPRVFILEKGIETRHHNCKTYRFTVTKNRGILVKWGGNYRYCSTEEARWMYRNLLNDGYKRVA